MLDVEEIEPERKRLRRFRHDRRSDSKYQGRMRLRTEGCRRPEEGEGWGFMADTKLVVC